MPKLKEVDITYRQIADLVSQLEFEEYMKPGFVSNCITKLGLGNEKNIR